MKFFGIFIVFALSALVLNAEPLTKKYFVKGMHCGGCESGVRVSLKELGGLSDNEILKVDHTSPDAEKQIGHVLVQFSKTKYEGKSTDCQLAKAVKKNPGYDLYWDEKNTNPCGLK